MSSLPRVLLGNSPASPPSRGLTAHVVHAPVMSSEVVAALVSEPGGVYVDGTVGGGGHAAAILGAAGSGARLIAIDRDPAALALASEALDGWPGAVQFICGNFCDLPQLIPPETVGAISGILLDLGLRSGALDDPERGFAYRAAGPLDMRFNPEVGESASDFLARVEEAELVRMLSEGTTRANPRTIALGIVRWREQRGLATTGDLVACLRSTLRRAATPKLLSSVFATLRMAVNRELEALDTALETLPGLLKMGGILCVLAYQSQEDRPVKRLRDATFIDPSSGAGYRMRPLSRKPLRPTREEGLRNRRALSARLRAFRREAATT